MRRTTGQGLKLTGIKDKKITIVGVIESVGPSGYGSEKFYDLCEKPVWANYRSLSGNEYFAAAAFNYKAEAVFTVNWRDNVEPGMYVLYKGKAYTIVYVDDLEGYKKDLKLFCETHPHLTEKEIDEQLEAAQG